MAQELIHTEGARTTATSKLEGRLVSSLGKGRRQKRRQLLRKKLAGIGGPGKKMNY